MSIRDRAPRRPAPSHSYPRAVDRPDARTCHRGLIGGESLFPKEHLGTRELAGMWLPVSDRTGLAEVVAVALG